MVFHVGIDFNKGFADVYDSISNITKRNILIRRNPHLNVEGVDESFMQTLDDVNGTLGYACIYLGFNDVKNEIRKHIIEKGKECGFQKVRIIDFYAIEYLGNIYAEYLKIGSNYKPNDGDIIWKEWVNSRNWFIFEIMKNKAKIVKHLTIPFFDKTIKILLKIKNDSGIDKNPSYIFINGEMTSADQQSMLNLEQRLFPECKAIINNSNRENYPKSSWALVKARIMAKDPEVLKYDVYEHLEKNLDLVINGKKIISFNKAELLPQEKTILVDSKSIEKMAIIREGETPDEITNYPMNVKMQIKLTIDESNIFTLDFIPISPYSLTLCNKYVTIYNSKTKVLKKFPATIDYGFNPPKVAVNYCSPTVIDYFQNQKDGKNCVKTRAIYLLNQINVYFVLYIDGTKSLIENKRVIADLLRGAAKSIDDSENIVHFTIPSNLSESENSYFLMAAKTAGLNNIELVDEQFALANGYEKLYSIKEGKIYILVHVSGPKVTISKFIAQKYPKNKIRRIMIDISSLKSSKNLWFDDIIASEETEKNNEENNNFENIVNEIFGVINASLMTNSIHNPLHSIAIISDDLIYTLAKDLFPFVPIIFIDNPEEIIAKGAIICYTPDNANKVPYLTNNTYPLSTLYCVIPPTPRPRRSN